MIACHCRGVSDRAVLAAIARGARTVSDIQRACGAGDDCGGCEATLAAMVRHAERPPLRDSAGPRYALAREGR
ncbi:MAG TPA: (2Fe-2S)-binding protein [Candidatus Methylomirabilis sp.]|nr:(2Fe-2S)-binding protein [Candidatus Methylomirabilis sp.]